MEHSSYSTWGYVGPLRKGQAIKMTKKDSKETNGQA